MEGWKFPKKMYLPTEKMQRFFFATKVQWPLEINPSFLEETIITRFSLEKNIRHFDLIFTEKPMISLRTVKKERKIIHDKASRPLVITKDWLVYYKKTRLRERLGGKGS